MAGMSSPSRQLRHVDPQTDQITDEIRRSGRATKGQNTKERDIDDTPAKKKGKGKGAKAKAAEEEEEEQGEDFVRCVCGLYEEEEDVPRSMICCDNCIAWEHNDCMGLPEDYAPESYYCEQCHPQDHKELLAAMARGEKPWEEIGRKRDAAHPSKKKGKKGRKSGAADESPKPATPSAAGQKRKAEESPAAPDTKASHTTLINCYTNTTQGNKKARGTPAAETNGKPTASRKASATPSRQTPVVVRDVKQLPAARKGTAQGLIKGFIEATKNVVKQASYQIPAKQNADSFATDLALDVEEAIYKTLSGGAGEPSDAYKTLSRSLYMNLKKNVSLTEKILNGEITPEELAGMSVEDLATDEQKQADAARLKEHDKQHIIVGDGITGPRIRRTHKGDEYVNEDNVPESASRSDPKPKQEDAKSPDTTSPKAPARRQPSVTIPRSGGPRRQSSANFDINKVWSNVQGSPDTNQQGSTEIPQAISPVREPAGPGARPDRDIDELLKDEEAESPPYSPKDDSSTEGIVWQGVINGGNLGRFHTSARYAVGATPDSETLQTTWAALLPEEIAIGGRIAPGKADDYLCGLEWSNSSDLLIVWMHEPESSLDREQFNKFFGYFKSKDRFGVGLQHHNPALKDIYFVPLDKGEEMPTFVKKLESDWPNVAADRMLLVPLVVRNAELPHSSTAGTDGHSSQLDGTLQSPAVHQTPITPREDWHNGAQAFPPHMQNGGQPPNYASPPPPYTANVPTPQPPHAPPAAIAAHRILGLDATKPAVLQLINSAPNAGDEEMRVIKECILQDGRAAHDLGLLTKMLQDRHSRQQESGNAMEGVEGTNAQA